MVRRATTAARACIVGDRGPIPVEKPAYWANAFACWVNPFGLRSPAPVRRFGAGLGRAQSNRKTPWSVGNSRQRDRGLGDYPAPVMFPAAREELGVSGGADAGVHRI